MQREPKDRETIEKIAKRNRNFAAVVPHNLALGLTIEELGDCLATMRLPYHEKLVGNPVSGVLHGGAVTSLMDACCGAAVFMALTKPMVIATLDLRIDYLKPATPKLNVEARAECYKVTQSVAFVRCLAYHEDESDPIAAGVGSFILTPGHFPQTVEAP